MNSVDADDGAGDAVRRPRARGNERDAELVKSTFCNQVAPVRHRSSLRHERHHDDGDAQKS